MKIYIETLQKQTIAQNSQLLTWSLFTQEIFQGQDSSKSASYQFSISATRNAITKATAHFGFFPF